jgi:UDP-GlcNAc:undecaprenyl-phosphate GlcNAc-1-phosphate transferase
MLVTANLGPEPVFSFILVFVLSLSLTVALVPLADYLGRRFGVMTKAGGRRQTEADKRGVSRLGSIALFGGFTVTVLVAQFLPVPRLDPNESIRLTGLLLGSTLIFVVGVLDDFFEFSSKPLFAAQFAAAGIAIAFQIFIEYLNNPFTGQQTDPWPFVVTLVLSLFWMVGMMNTVNWLDGLDGLAGGVALIAGLMLFINSAFRVEPAQTSVSLLPLALVGTTLGFLLFNFYPARLIMGGGAFYLGYLMGTLSIIGGAKMATILLVMGLPLMDVAWQIINRLWHRRNPVIGDRGHVHFRLQDMGFSQRQIVLAYYLFCAFFGVLTLITTSQLFKFVSLGVMLVLVGGGFVMLARWHQAESSSPVSDGDSSVSE